MLLLTEVDLISKKRGCKQNLVWPDSFYSNKVIFILLAKVITLYVKPTAVDVQSLGFEFIFKRSTF